MVVLDGLLQGGEAFAGVVEIGDGFDQPLAGQIHQQALELAERPAGLVGLLGRLHRLVGLDALDENKRAPDLAVAVLVKGFAVAGGDHDQRTAGDVPDVAAFELLADVGGHPHDVLHHRRPGS